MHNNDNNGLLGHVVDAYASAGCRRGRMHVVTSRVTLGLNTPNVHLSQTTKLNV